MRAFITCITLGRKRMNLDLEDSALADNHCLCIFYVYFETQDTKFEKLLAGLMTSVY